MLGKLLKYDLKNMFKFLSIFYILAIAGAILTRIFFEIKHTAIIVICGQIMCGFMYAMIANVFVNTIIRLWVAFKSSIYGDEGYLLNTLPVSKNSIYLSKFLLALLSLLASFLVILISLFITYYSKDFYNTCISMLDNISVNWHMGNLNIVITFLTIFFLEIFTVITAGYLSTIIGHRKNNNKIIHSFTIGVIIYSCSQLLILLFLFIYGIFNNNIMQMFLSNNIDFSIFKPLLYFSMLIYCFIILIYYLLSNYYFNKGINID